MLFFSVSLNFAIQIVDKRHPEAVAGLLLLALRDLGCKLYALGGGQNVGKGYVDVKSITIHDWSNNTECSLDSSFMIHGDRGVIDCCMGELRKSATAREAM